MRKRPTDNRSLFDLEPEEPTVTKEVPHDKPVAVDLGLEAALRAFVARTRQAPVATTVIPSNPPPLGFEGVPAAIYWRWSEGHRQHFLAAGPVGRDCMVRMAEWRIRVNEWRDLTRVPPREIAHAR